MNLFSIDTARRFLSYQRIRRYAALFVLMGIFSPDLALADGDNTNGGQDSISQQGDCEAVCQLPDQAPKTLIPSVPIVQAEVKELVLLQ